MDILRRDSAQLSDAVWKELDEAAATAGQERHDRAADRHVRRPPRLGLHRDAARHDEGLRDARGEGGGLRAGDRAPRADPGRLHPALVGGRGLRAGRARRSTRPRPRTPRARSAWRRTASRTPASPSGTGFLEDPGSPRLRLGDWSDPVRVIGDLVQAVEMLDRLTVPGPYEAVLSPDRYYAYLAAANRGYPVPRHTKNIIAEVAPLPRDAGRRRALLDARRRLHPHRRRRPRGRLPVARPGRAAPVLRRDPRAADPQSRRGVPPRGRRARAPDRNASGRLRDTVSSERRGGVRIARATAARPPSRPARIPPAVACALLLHGMARAKTPTKHEEREPKTTCVAAGRPRRRPDPHPAGRAEAAGPAPRAERGGRRPEGHHAAPDRSRAARRLERRRSRCSRSARRTPCERARTTGLALALAGLLGAGCAALGPVPDGSGSGTESALRRVRLSSASARRTRRGSAEDHRALGAGRRQAAGPGQARHPVRPEHQRRQRGRR